MLLIARDWVEANGRPAVVLCVDLFSTHLQAGPYDKEKAVCLTLFGDAGAAVVLTPGEGPGLEIVDREMRTVPEYADALQVHMENSGLRVSLGASMPDAVGAAVAKPVDALLARNELRREDITWWAVHPGGLRIIDRVVEQLNVPDESVAFSKGVYAEHGNTSSAAVLTVLQRIQAAAPLPPGGYGVALAFGPGVSIWALLLRG